MAEMKYIMINWKDREIPVIFTDVIPHIDMFEAIKKQIPEMHNATVSSAGQLQLQVSSVFGHSSTLKLEPHEADIKIINTINYMHGIGFK